MILFKSWLLPATCTIILVLTAYATLTEAARQKQAEVNLQQQYQQQQQRQQQQLDANATNIVAPAKPLKYGDKTTKKSANAELLLLTTAAPTIIRNFTNGVVTTRRGSRFRAEYIELPTNTPTTHAPQHQNSGPVQNQLIVQQHDIPIVHKNSELFNKPITTTTAGQLNQHQQPRQRMQQNTNRSRSHNAISTTTLTQQQQQQPTQYSNLKFDSEKTIAKTKTTTATRTTTTALTTQTKYRQQRLNETTTFPQTIASAASTKTINHSSLLSRNANVSSSSSQVTHHQNRSNLNNTRSTNSNKHQIAVATTAPTKSRGNVKNTQSIIGTSTTVSMRNTTRRFSTSSTSLKSTPTSLLPSSSSSLSSVITTISPRTRLLMTTTTTTSTTSPTPPLLFQFPNNFNFNIFTPEFWQFLNPTTSAPATTKRTTTTQPITKRPPKKYRPPTQISTKEEKLNLVKPKQNIPSRTTTTTTTKKPEPLQNNNIVPPKRDDGPFRIALPTFNILNSRRETFDDSEKGKRNVESDISLRERFECPRESEVRFQLFPKICKIDEDCKVWNREEICCEIFGAKSCVTGIPKPLEETSHAPILGVIPRKCPNRPLAELWWEVKECETDMDCWPRVCCPDGRRRYCRTSQPELSTVPVPVKRSFNYLSEYLECTPPPPPIFDLHPKTCTSTLDCFPNVCCQEAGLRHCRPPKKSVLTMLANVFNVDFVKRLTQNIVIK